jgi:hypothetical protein
VLPRSTARDALRRRDPAPALKRREVAELGVGDRDHVAALAAVAAVRAALGNILLATERERAVAAAPGLDVDLGAVAEQI